MTDQEPTDGEATSGAPAADEPTISTTPVAAPVTAPAAPPPGYVPAASVPTAPAPRQGLFVPRWLAILAGAILAALVFGAIGFAVGDSGGDDRDAPRGQVGPGGGNGNRIGPNGGQNTPDLRRPGNNGGVAPGRGDLNPPTPANPTGSGFLGVSVGATSSGTGAQITTVSAGSPAANAGLKSGDVVTAVNGTTIGTPADLVKAIGSHNSGETVKVTYSRSVTSTTVSITLANRNAANSIPS